MRHPSTPLYGDRRTRLPGGATPRPPRGAGGADYGCPCDRGFRTRRALRLVLPRRPCLGILEENTQRVELLPDPVGLGEVLPGACFLALLDPALDLLGGGPSQPEFRLRAAAEGDSRSFGDMLIMPLLAPEVLLRGGRKQPEDAEERFQDLVPREELPHPFHFFPP